MSYIEFGRSVDLPRIRAVDRADEAPVVGRLPKGMSEIVTEHEGNPVRFVLSHGHLEAVVVGKIAVRQPINVIQIREFAVEGLRRNLICSQCAQSTVRKAIVITCCSALHAVECRSTRDCWVSPRYTHR